ncbi:DUF4150 domain-containing protein [Nannocystis sp. ILAH1]|uniref:PAAR-like domain-containing protein n=1 Tax=Nannocystis sp. ILAH1 TaxID=2996789 RepID=UPI0022705D49|nr:PAAR-like domain-containing protein [Nannocystis sp. ILAH1]MCY0989474.1 DUF4150 domain-containing protein [Nannocystis sp. ILAH1]
MARVTVNSPKTPVTKTSGGVASATVPNVCKMPGPPAPFVPTPLPNVGRSSESPKGYTKSVKIEGSPAAVKGASFNSKGDIASKATGGGLFSANTHGATKFVAPGSLDVKFEGKNVHLLGDQMLNNWGPSTPNSATLAGVVQTSGTADAASSCPCTRVRREPDLRTMGYYDKDTPGDGDIRRAQAKLNKAKKKMIGLEKKRARVSGKAAKEVDKAIEDLRSDLVGLEWEIAVAEDVGAKFAGVELYCEDCGRRLGEFDVITNQGIVKECKASWGAMKPDKFITQMHLVEERGLLGPGMKMHYAIPKGERGPLERKFESIGKDKMRGRIQEH